MKALALATLLVLVLVVAIAPSGADEIGLAMIADGSSPASGEIDEIFRQELLALLEGEIDLRIERFEGDWTESGIHAALERAYADPGVDLVLVTGIVANQILGAGDVYPKPTFLPIVFDARLLDLPRGERGSGRTNLNYLSDELGFTTDLEDFLEVVSFDKVALLIDGIVLQTFRTIELNTREIAATRQIEVVAVPYSDPTADLVALIPRDADAVMIDGLFRLTPTAVERLIDGLIARRLPSFSLAGEGLVERGLLTTGAPESDWQRLARRIALNVQAVILGEKAADQPVDFVLKRQRYVNLETARAIDVWPSFDILLEAVILGDAEPAAGPRWTLTQVAEAALARNLDLLAEHYGTEAGAADIRAARSALLPQLSIDLATTQLDRGSAAVASGAAARRSTDGSLTVRQSLWTESLFAQRDLQIEAQRSREAELEAFRLDTLQAATLAFLDILRAETQFRVQRENLELTRANLDLARDRVRVGSAKASDIYRWQSELATARQDAVFAYAERSRAREQLNRLLNRPLDTRIELDPPTLEPPLLLSTEDEIGSLIDNPKAFLLLMDFLVRRGIEQSPELASLRAVIAAKKRELLSGKRSFYSPDVSLQGQISEVLEEDRSAGLSLEGESDWSIRLLATLPLFDGGLRSAQVTRARLELQQLETRFASLQEQIAQGVRADMHLANASYRSISLAREAAEAAKKTLELITDSYSQGVVNILDLLDAQSAALRANQSAANAVYNFLIDLMNVQRAVGRFDFFLERPERQAELGILRHYIATEGRNHE